MSIVNVVHCIDTEGPLDESIEATFDRIRTIFGLDLPPMSATLAKLQRRELNLDGLENAVALAVDPKILGYKRNWPHIDEMLDQVMSSNFRRLRLDSFGQGWLYNWHCVAHVDYIANPRRRDLGWHKVYDHYVNRLSKLF